MFVWHLFLNEAYENIALFFTLIFSMNKVNLWILFTVDKNDTKTKKIL